MSVKGSPTQVPQKQTRAAIRVARTDDDICQFVAPHAQLPWPMTREASGRRGGCPRAQIGRALRAVVVERSEEVGRPLCPLRLHLHPIGRPGKDASGKDEKMRASPDYENANGHVDAQRDPSRRTDAAKVATGSSMGQSPSARAYSG